MMSTIRIIATWITLASFVMPVSAQNLTSPWEAYFAQAAASAQANQRAVVPGKDGWLFLSAELRFLGSGEFWGDKAAIVSRATKPEWADPLPAILDFKEQLEKMNILLIVVPVPAKAAVYDEFLPNLFTETEAQRADAAFARFIRTLASHGVVTLDLLPAFKSAARESTGLLYCKTDTHWTPTGARLAATEIAQLLSKLFTGGTGVHGTEFRTITFTGDLTRLRKLKEPDAAETPETVQGIVPIPVTSGISEVLILGDSHLLVWHAGSDLYAEGLGLSDYLSEALGLPVDILAVRGSGATPARTSLRERMKTAPDYLKGRKALIWCFAAREFTEAQGWRKIQLAP